LCKYVQYADQHRAVTLFICYHGQVN